MWVHGCGLFRISTEPEFSEFITPDRGSAVRIRTGGCGGEDPLGAELPHPLRAHHPGRPGAFGYLCARGVSVRDRIGALGGGVRFLLAETNTEPGSCGASHDPCCAREEEEQEAARGGVGRTAVNVRSVSGSRSPTSPSSRRSSRGVEPPRSPLSKINFGGSRDGCSVAPARTVSHSERSLLVGFESELLG